MEIKGLIPEYEVEVKKTDPIEACFMAFFTILFCLLAALFYTNATTVMVILSAIGAIWCGVKSFQNIWPEKEYYTLAKVESDLDWEKLAREYEIILVTDNEKSKTTYVTIKKRNE